MTKCKKRNYSIPDFNKIIEYITEIDDIDEYEKNIIITRFTRISKYVTRNYKILFFCYHFSKLFLIISGILTPALLSFNTGNLNSPYYYLLFSVIWVLQLSISIITSFTSFYKWDKKYFLFMAYKNKIDQEVWLYLELSSKYGILNKKNKLEKRGKKVTHKSKLPFFLNRIEYLFKKLKELDYEIEINDNDNDTDKDKTETKVDIDGISPSFLQSNLLTTTPPTQTPTFDVNKLNTFLKISNNIITLRNNNTGDISNASEFSDKIKIEMTKITDFKKELLSYKKKDNYNFDLYLLNSCSKYNSGNNYDKFTKFICEQLDYETMPTPTKIL
tara:strand:+ start:137 stop:1126 length:990 start_codon:yes stop_codon:yes gene_type:complete